jgi:hypothetical protein
MTAERSASSQRWRVWAAFLLLALFTALPGPNRSPFSGIPLSSKASLVAVALLVGALTLILFPPRRRTGGGWLLALVLICGAKLAISPALRDEGWRGQYWTAQILEFPAPRVAPLAPVRFFGRGDGDSRVDAALAFNDVNFALFYVNDWPDPLAYLTNTSPRHIAQPLRVHWTGYIKTPPETAVSTAVTATGWVRIDIDGAEAFHGTNPAAAPIRRILPAGEHRLDIVYDKPPGEKPGFVLSPLPFSVMPSLEELANLTRSRVAAHAIDLLGLIALLVFAGMLFAAYRPITLFLLGDIWEAPDKVILIILVGLFLISGFNAALDVRGATVPLPRADDPLAYEASARAVLFNGMSMRTHTGDSTPYFFYPGYSYALAAAHLVFGEDYGTIRFFNWLCLAVTAVLLWTFLRRWLTSGSLIFFLVLCGLFSRTYLAPYTHTAFTDNLYVPLCVAVVIACARSFERNSNAWLLLAGVLTAAGAATRPSLTLFPPFLIVALLLFWKKGFAHRMGAVASFFCGLAVGLSPFIVRNWIVARRLVLLSSMYIMLPYFLYAPGRTDIPTTYLQAHTRTASEAIVTFFKVFASAPWQFLSIEVRKALFTIGIAAAGPSGCECPHALILIPLFFALAAWSKRIPRPIMIAISTFAVAHLAAMVVAAPWTYGYKTILPFHLMLLTGAVFLLPQRSNVRVRQPAITRGLPTVRQTVSVVLPTYNEKDSIKQVILDFFATGVVDEVIVVNNNAVAGTSEQVAGSGAREVIEPRQGYGAATRRGLREATSDLIVICEPDGTFLPRDIHKLLAYAHDFDVVYGSRTFQPLVWHGANMGFFLRFGNWAVARYMQLIFNTPSLSDVGCTMRLIKRSVAEELADKFSIDGSQFGVEMMVLTVRHNYRVAQIPVNYAKRVGLSSVTGDPAKAFWLGLQMIWLITKHRIREAIVSRGDQSLGAVHTPTINS